MVCKPFDYGRKLWCNGGTVPPLHRSRTLDYVCISLSVIKMFFETFSFFYIIWNRYGVHPLTPLKGLFIQGPVFISFFLAVRFSFPIQSVECFRS